jgi:hypothetical protein
MGERVRPQTPLPTRIRNRMGVRGVSCDSCGTPWPSHRLRPVGDFLLGPCCKRVSSEKDLDEIESQDPSLEPLGAVFNGVR